MLCSLHHVGRTYVENTKTQKDRHKQGHMSLPLMKPVAWDSSTEHLTNIHKSHINPSIQVCVCVRAPPVLCADEAPVDVCNLRMPHKVWTPEAHKMCITRYRKFHPDSIGRESPPPSSWPFFKASFNPFEIVVRHRTPLAPHVPARMTSFAWLRFSSP